MNFNFFNFTSKTFWLGAVMVAAGLVEGLGLPVIGDVLHSIWPSMTADQLITAGLAMIFMRDAIAKATK